MRRVVFQDEGVMLTRGRYGAVTAAKKDISKNNVGLGNVLEKIDEPYHLSQSRWQINGWKDLFSYIGLSCLLPQDTSQDDFCHALFKSRESQVQFHVQDLLRLELSKKSKFHGNFGHFPQRLTHFWSNFVLTDVFTLLNISLEKSAT